jgi:hypothetical protein
LAIALSWTEGLKTCAMCHRVCKQLLASIMVPIQQECLCARLQAIVHPLAAQWQNGIFSEDLSDLHRRETSNRPKAAYFGSAAQSPRQQLFSLLLSTHPLSVHLR